MTINAIRSHLDANRAFFGLPENACLSVELRAPWRASHSSRALYYIYCGDSSTPSLVIKDAQPVFAPALPLAPVPFIASLMPRQGVFSLSGQAFAWAEFVHGEVLADLLRARQPARSRSGGKNDPPAAWRILVKFAQRLLDEQAAQARQADMPLEELFAAFLPRIALSGGRSMLRDFRDVCRLGQTSALSCSWSHGDLWPRDIFVTPTGFRVIDWEWFSPQAPLGTDSLDLLATVAQHVLGYATEEMWRALLSGAEPALNIIRDKVLRLHPPETWPMLFHYCLARSFGRELVQDGPSQRLWDQYAVLAGMLKEYGAQAGGATKR